MKKPANQKKYDTILIGRYKKGKDQCDACTKADKIIPKQPAVRRHRHIDIDSKKGKEVSNKLKIKDMPTVLRCPIDPKQRCVKITGWRGVDDYK